MNAQKKNQKVAHVIGSLRIGGAERFIIDLSVAQKKLGIKPAVVSLGDPDDELVSVCTENKVPVATYSRNSYWKLFRVVVVLMKFDVIHIHSPHALKYLRFFLPLLNKRIIYTRHGAAPYSQKFWLAFHKKVEKYISSITFVSQQGLDNFQNTHKWKSATVTVIDNGVLVEQVKDKLSKSDILRIGSVGRSIPLKNQLGLLKAIRNLSPNNKLKVEVNFFGDGPCLESLKEFHKIEIPEVYVRFHGMVNDREVIYSAFDLLVVASETEGLSMVIIEAMANKIPVIATNVGGNPRLVQHDKTGRLFNFDDDEILSEHIQHFIDNHQLIKELGDNAFEYISANFSIESAAKKYL